MFTCLFTFLAPGLLLTGLVLLVPVAALVVILASLLFWLVVLERLGRGTVWMLKQGRS